MVADARRRQRRQAEGDHMRRRKNLRRSTTRRSAAKHRHQPPGSTTARGYGSQHQRLRARLAPQVAAGQAVCARCGQPIHPAEPWHLDHHDTDRSRYIGVSHEACNINAAQHRRFQPPTTPTPRPPALAFFDPPRR
jgi:hypothetical protein